MDKNLIQEINKLSKKAKDTGLTDEEKQRQDELRKQYIKEFKSNMRSQIEKIVIVEKDGKLTPVKRIK